MDGIQSGHEFFQEKSSHQGRQHVYEDIKQYEQMGFFHISIPTWVTDLLNISKQPTRGGTQAVMSMEEAVSYGYRFVAHEAMSRLALIQPTP